jgi:hypothetical protein
MDLQPFLIKVKGAFTGRPDKKPLHVRLVTISKPLDIHCVATLATSKYRSYKLIFRCTKGRKFKQRTQVEYVKEEASYKKEYSVFSEFDTLETRKAVFQILGIDHSDLKSIEKALLSFRVYSEKEVVDTIQNKKSSSSIHSLFPNDLVWQIEQFYNTNKQSYYTRTLDAIRLSEAYSKGFDSDALETFKFLIFTTSFNNDLFEDRMTVPQMETIISSLETKPGACKYTQICEFFDRTQGPIQVQEGVVCEICAGRCNEEGALLSILTDWTSVTRSREYLVRKFVLEIAINDLKDIQQVYQTLTDVQLKDLLYIVEHNLIDY